MRSYKYTIESSIEGAVTHVDNIATSSIARTASLESNREAGIYLSSKTRNVR